MRKIIVGCFIGLLATSSYAVPNPKVYAFKGNKLLAKSIGNVEGSVNTVRFKKLGKFVVDMEKHTVNGLPAKYTEAFPDKRTKSDLFCHTTVKGISICEEWMLD